MRDQARHYLGTAYALRACVDGLRLVVLAGSIAAGMLGTLYAGAVDVFRTDAPPVIAPEPRSDAIAPDAIAPDAIAPDAIAADAMTPIAPYAIPAGIDVPEAVAARFDADADIVDPESGVRLGPLTFHPPAPPEVVEPPSSRASSAARRPAAPRPASIPRLHSDPGMHVILTARRMMAQGETIQGSCYRYLSEVFQRAGHDTWRTRRDVFSGGRNGPYANLDLIRPGDWLYIVNHPERTPVGTHSVLFVGWADRAQGYAHVIEHSGWGAPSAGQERTYDVSRTYRILRPTL